MLQVWLDEAIEQFDLMSVEFGFTVVNQILKENPCMKDEKHLDLMKCFIPTGNKNYSAIITFDKLKKYPISIQVRNVERGIYRRLNYKIINGVLDVNKFYEELCKRSIIVPSSNKTELKVVQIILEYFKNNECDIYSTISEPFVILGIESLKTSKNIGHHIDKKLLRNWYGEYVHFRLDNVQRKMFPKLGKTSNGNITCEINPIMLELQKKNLS